jgi:hypothetical protein
LASGSEEDEEELLNEPGQTNKRISGSAILQKAFVAANSGNGRGDSEYKRERRRCWFLGYAGDVQLQTSAFKEGTVIRIDSVDLREKEGLWILCVVFVRALQASTVLSSLKARVSVLRTGLWMEKRNGDPDAIKDTQNEKVINKADIQWQAGSDALCYMGKHYFNKPEVCFVRIT